MVYVLPAPPANCTTAVDLIFMMDCSGSIDSANYEQMKSFVSQLVNNFDVDSGNARVGLLTFSTVVEATFNLSKYSSRAEVRAAISDLTYSAGRTNTGDALAYVRQVMLQPAAGDRPYVSNVVVILTDGGSNDKLPTQVRLVSSLSSFTVPSGSYTVKGNIFMIVDCAT